MFFDNLFREYQYSWRLDTFPKIALLSVLYWSLCRACKSQCQASPCNFQPWRVRKILSRKSWITCPLHSRCRRSHRWLLSTCRVHSKSMQCLSQQQRACRRHSRCRQSQRWLLSTCRLHNWSMQRRPQQQRACRRHSRCRRSQRWLLSTW
jgi:hypothetical protein